MNKLCFSFLLFFLVPTNAIIAAPFSVAKPQITAPSPKAKYMYTNKITLEFDRNNVQLATFERNGWYWFVFNNQTINNIDQLLRTQFHYPTEIIQNNDQSLIFRIKTYIKPSITYNINHINISVNPSLTHSYSRKLTPVTNQASVSLAIFNNVKQKITVTDPDIGDKIIIIPGNSDNVILDKDYKFTHFNLLNSKYGLAINAISDQINVIIRSGTVYVYYPEISINYDTIKIATPIFNFKEWANDNKPFNQELSNLQNIVLTNSTIENRLNLVRFFLGNKMPQEALLYLGYIKTYNGNYYNDYNFKLLYIASLYLTQQYNKANIEIAKLDLDNFNYQQLIEINFWKNAIAMQIGSKEIYLNYSEHDFIKQYQWYDSGFALLELKQAISKFDDQRIIKMQNILKKKSLSQYQYNNFTLLIAEAMMKIGEYHEALAVYDSIASDAYDTYHKALAILKKTQYLYKNEVIDLPSSIEQLEKLKILVRNEDIEANLLDTLATLYIEDKKYYDGLSALQEIHTNFTYYDKIIEVNHKIHNLLIHIFNPNYINEVHPLVLIDIFVKFKDLMPLGREGTDIALNFTNYLIKINLVAEATSFLEHLIKYKLDGQEKIDSIIKLAQLYLQDKQPNKTIALLRKYDVISQQAQYLQSRAFFDLKEYKIALALLNNDYSDNANEIRADILWYSKSWSEIIWLLEPKMQFRPDPKENLAPLEQKYLLYLAVSYFQSGNKNKLNNLYEAFKNMNAKNNKVVTLLKEVLEGDKISMETLNKIYNMKFD